ncbi:DUF6521 family protein [Enterococcus sp. BWT-B8]|uniref:three component ABC system middle component n=1 Tax=Enterococcus sp. BWT-B8 TaxID=2885157 RepID=UPI001E5210AE|nr:three component ABC system middle component [Enterococcus sp. BWT-B8]MCB5953348.1 DUF6521 family protein [Enterococcus sp. BWT-B8]
MIPWKKRAPEIANLLNPSFCAIILYQAIQEYQKKDKDGVPFPLIYLILPIILPKNLRFKINSRTNMVIWIQRNPEILVGFAKRANNLVSFTNEAIEFLLLQGTIKIEKGKIILGDRLSRNEIKKYAEKDSEVQECLDKSRHIARWFFYMKAEENVYAAWGVRP